MYLKLTLSESISLRIDIAIALKSLILKHSVKRRGDLELKYKNLLEIKDIKEFSKKIKPNYQYWGKKSSWNAHQGTCLLMGINPNFLTEEIVNEMTTESPLKDEIKKQLYDLLQDIKKENEQ